MGFLLSFWGEDQVEDPPQAGVRGNHILRPAKQTQSGLDELLQFLRLGRSDPIHFVIFHVKLNGHRAGYVIEPAAWYFSVESLHENSRLLLHTLG